MSDKIAKAVAKLDKHVEKHRDQGKTVPVATAKALLEIRREKRAK